MPAQVEWFDEGTTVHVKVEGTVDPASARHVSAAIATHVGVEGVEVVEVDTSAASILDGGERVFEELGRRFAGAGQRLVLTDEALGGDRAAAPR